MQTAVFTWVLKLTPAVYWAYIRSTSAELNCSAAFLPEGSVEHSAGGPPGLRGLTARTRSCGHANAGLQQIRSFTGGVANPDGCRSAATPTYTLWIHRPPPAFFEGVELIDCQTSTSRAFRFGLDQPCCPGHEPDDIFRDNRTRRSYELAARKRDGQRGHRRTCR